MHPATEGMHTAQGPLCAPCFTNLETKVPAARSPFARLGLQLAPSLIGLGVMAGCVAFGTVEIFTGKGGMGWLLLALITAGMGLMAALHSARGMRDGLNVKRLEALTEDGLPVVVDRSAVAVDGVGVALGGLLTFASGALFLAPYRIGMPACAFS